MQHKYTIEDVAKIAGVSRGTVSRVLNNHPAVSDEARAKVLEAIEKSNYRPNFSARHMRTDSSNLIGFGLLADEVITTPYAVDMIRGAQEALWAMGKVMLVVNAGKANGESMTETSLEALLERRVEGIIYAAMFHHAVEIPPSNSQVPIVLANCFSEDRRFPSVVPDEVAGGYAATKHLLEAGHKRIGFINLSSTHPSVPSPIPAASGRLKGYKKALEEFDVPFDESLILYTKQTPQRNYELTMDLMQMPNPPTAIFCGNDRTAMACYGALSHLGLRIPQDVAVVGFDNQLDLAPALWPSLTTVQLPHYEMGKWAVEYLFSVKEKSPQPIQHMIDCPLIIRESV
ncbi:MAG: LacI family DNA-binding transcriptional regulator [Chloroflexi bacterium]|nr:LacI family DNA-binding transcriptional regulator [Chloroflexota bacterium]